MGIGMPSVLYKRTPEMLERAKRCLAIGRTASVRAKAAETIRRISKDPEWRIKVSLGTRAAVAAPEVKARTLAAARLRVKNLKWGNGQPPGPKVMEISLRLLPLGYIMEYPIKTRNHGTSHSAPTCYKVDFGNPEKKIAVEIDGPSHRSFRSKQLDQKKTEVLNALGWKVARIRH